MPQDDAWPGMMLTSPPLSLYLRGDCLRTFGIVASCHTPCVLLEGIVVGFPMRLEVGELREGFGGEAERGIEHS